MGRERHIECEGHRSRTFRRLLLGNRAWARAPLVNYTTPALMKGPARAISPAGKQDVRLQMPPGFCRRKPPRSAPARICRFKLPDLNWSLPFLRSVNIRSSPLRALRSDIKTPPCCGLVTNICDNRGHGFAPRFFPPSCCPNHGCHHFKFAAGIYSARLSHRSAREQFVPRRRARRDPDARESLVRSHVRHATRRPRVQ